MVTTGRASRFARRLLHAVRRDLAGCQAAVGCWLPRRPRLLTYHVDLPGGSRRLHLRLQTDGSATLLVDVTEAIHLNPTAAALAQAALDGKPLRHAMATLRGRFHGTRRADPQSEAERIYALVEHLRTTTDRCPTCGLLGVDRTLPFSAAVSAPYKADLALSYDCNNACRHCYNPPARMQGLVLGLPQWRRVLRRLSAVGVPHVIFTGGEPTLVPHLPALVRDAEQLGLLSGINSNGRRLADRTFARTLYQAGLSHVQITVESHRRDVHNAMTAADSFDETIAGITNSLAAGLHTITNTTLTQQNADQAVETVDFLHRLGLRTFAINGMIYSGRGQSFGEAIAAERLAGVLLSVRDRALALGMRLLWYTPTPYCQLSPLELDLGPRRCNAAEYSICIEPNGDVLPCQSYYTAAGNILRDPWQRIWQSELFHSFRDRTAEPHRCGLPPACWNCPDLPLCGGGCRLERENTLRESDEHHTVPQIAASGS
jgi:radical SAM protein with 4Fe4S-binding SPASM domain